MANLKYLTLAQLAPAFALLACAAPKAHVVEPPKPPSETAAVVPTVADPGPLPPSDGGIRLPDMLALPGDAEFRATSPTATQKSKSDSGAVISRPPTDPPSRPKPAGGE